MRIANKLILWPIAVAMGFASTGVNAETCTRITSVPFVITQPGAYCVRTMLRASIQWGAAIEIQANDVALDFGGGGLEQQSGGSDTFAVAVYALDRNNISIRNGTIQGFDYGILLENSAADFSGTTGHVISDMVLERILTNAIEVRGTNTVVKNNRIRRTGNQPLGSVVAIMIFGPGSQIQKNEITETTVTSSDFDAQGIHVQGGPGCVIEDNRIVNIDAVDDSSYGVLVWSSAGCVVRHNTFENRKDDPMGVGVWVIDSTGTQIRDNQFKNVIEAVRD
jgi:parallel beta-helix repeat protein